MARAIRAQGDILCVSTSASSKENKVSLPAFAQGGHILHVGEKSNHVHVLEGQEGKDFVAYACPEVEAQNPGIQAWRIDVLADKVTLKHVKTDTGKPTKEHGSIELEKGSWAVRTQREFGPDATPQRVVD